jgi:putative Holliday junction resolvase
VTRILGVDLGARRIGIAIADPDGRARPYVTLRRARSVEGDAEALRALVADQAVSELVIGLPLDLDGREGDQARRTRTWATAIGAALGLPISLADERLTSHVAEGRLGPMPRGRSGGPPTAAQRDRHRARVDREAAAIILQDELDRRQTARTIIRDVETDA